jgi:predicted Holliday junction resolvase-like endonuclease
MSKQIIYIIVIAVLAIICVIDFVRINALQSEVERTREMINESIDALNYKMDANIYKKDAQLLLMNQNYNNPQIHKILADSCYKDCMKYRIKHGKEAEK